MEKKIEAIRRFLKKKKCGVYKDVGGHYATIRDTKTLLNLGVQENIPKKRVIESFMELFGIRE